MSLAEQLEIQYGTLTAALTANIAKAQRTGSIDEQKALVGESEGQVREIDDLLEQIELVVHDERNDAERKRLVNTIASFKADARKLENELSKIRGQISQTDERSELFGGTADDEYAESQRALLISNTEVLERSNRQLQDAYDITLDTVDIGAQTLHNLESQRHVIKKARNRLRDANEDIYHSSRSLTAMLNRLMRDRLFLVIVGAVFLLFVIVLIFWNIRKT